jgi:hypothetical protein
MSRRTMLKGATALGALAVASGRADAQQAGTGAPAARFAAGAGTSLPPRGAFVIRGATVLTMEARFGDLAEGDVYVRDGTIIEVAAASIPPMRRSSKAAARSACRVSWTRTGTCGPACSDLSCGPTRPNSATSL